MPDSYDLTNLDAHSFEQMVNMLVLKVLGSGATSFAPGADGGRDGFFEGIPPYPSETNKWSGVWYIQSKFHKPHLSKDPQKWLLEQIELELTAFTQSNNRKWPDNWILATNVDPSGVPQTGAFDKAKAMVAARRPQLANRFHIWGGSKIIGFLVANGNVADYYGHFLTPGHVIKDLYEALADEKASIKDIIRFLVIKEFETHQFTKLDQAGSEADARPGVHKLYVDLPFASEAHNAQGLVAAELLRTSGKAHRESPLPDGTKWRRWRTFPSRARVWFVQGGPGQGKSTTGQYFSQLQRAALILDWDGDPAPVKCREYATEIKAEASRRNHWGGAARIPINIELKDYAQWFGRQPKDANCGILPYVAHKISSYVDKPVYPATLKRALRSQRWFVVFDGLDEVPNDVKNALAAKVKEFITDTTVECNSDVHFICSSRPQGYSGQFDDLECALVRLTELSPTKALECAEPVIRIGRTESEAAKGIAILRSAIASPAVKALMTTPLQSHIMAVVVRDGKKPPERRWQLFENFYQVIKRREANRDLPDERLAKLLREEEQLLRTIHNRLGFVLHAKAETSEGAQTSLSREEFKRLANGAVGEMKSDAISETVDALMEATATRLVLVNTPDDGGSLRFDIRQLQEFFAAEFIHEAVTLEQFRERTSAIVGDAHWREVLHFLLSAMVEARRITEITELVQALEALNDGGGDQQNRTIYRRLAKGALLAARLLQDGVLEQDKRIRAQFRNVLEPLAATTDSSDVEQLYQLEHPDSRNWLTEYCIERLREADYTESVGAAFILTRLLRDGDPRIDECLALFFARPTPYRALLLESWQSRDQEGQDLRVSHWVRRFAFNCITSEDWFQLGSSAVSGALSVLSISSSHLELEFRDLALPNSYFFLLSFISSNRPPEKQDEEPRTVEDFGFLLQQSTNFDWRGGLFSLNQLNEEPIPDEAFDDFGLLSLADAAWRFARDNSWEHFRRLRSLFTKESAATAAALPYNLRDYLPFGDEFGIKAVSCETSKDFSEWLSSAKRAVRFTRGAAEMDNKGLERLIEKFPAVAVHALFGGLVSSNTPHLNIRNFVPSLVSAAKGHPTLLDYLGILRWGILLKSPRDDAPEMRSLFREAAARPSLRFYWGFRNDSEIFPFEVNLPTEMSLVNSILLAAVDFTSFRPDLHFGHSHQPRQRDQLTEVCEIVGRFFSEVSQVRSVSLDSNHPTLSDGYMMLLKVLHPEIKDNFESMVEFLLKIPGASFTSDFLKLILFYVGAKYSEDDAVIVKFVSRLMDIAREDFELRERFYPLVRVWREKSHAPATKASALEQWINLI